MTPVYLVEITPMQANWLIGHTAYEEGVGREVYDAVRASMLRGEVEPPTARPHILGRVVDVTLR